MRLFGYYALHSFFNQVKKMMKTWVLIFLLACMLIGGAIGLGAAKLEEAAEEQSAAQETVEETVEETIPAPAEIAVSAGLDKKDVIELIAGAVILGLFVYQLLSADTAGSKIFLPADVNLLFASPMRPQSVLMFRLMTRLGLMIFWGFYMLFQLPNLVLNVGMPLLAALALIAAWCFTIVTGTLLQVLVYTVCSTHPGLKHSLRRIVYVLLGVVGLGYVLFWKRSGLAPLAAAAGFFNAPASRFVPLWGWIKGVFVFAWEGKTALALLCLGLQVLGILGLIFWVSRVKADFYEDAMAKSEETAALLEAARSEKGAGLARRRKKDRSDSVWRDGMRHGRGAWVFFFKSLYNRFRFAHLHFFTKTMETYLAVGAGAALLCRFVADTDSVLPAVLAIGAVAFFRTLGNPLEQDTKMDFFLLIPESTWSKLLASLLAGSVNCLLDILPGLLLASAILGVNPLLTLVWVPFIVSVDFYGTCVGAFIALSVPTHAGLTVKQVVQIMFIYFGLLPDIAILAVGMVMGHTGPAALFAALLNVLLGLTFFALTPLFLEPGAERAPRRPAETGAVDRKTARRTFSRLGLALALIIALGTALQLALFRFSPESWAERDWYLWVVTFAPLYLAAVPLGYLVMRRVKSAPGEKRSMSPGTWLAALVICFFMMSAGNVAGSGLVLLLRKLFGTEAKNAVLTYAMSDSLFWKILLLVILAPLIEEWIFRKTLVDRLRPYGEKLAVVVSAAAFGLFHGNFSQLFYAFGIGLVFGYVYLRTNRLRYSVGMHMTVNFLGSVLAPALLEWSEKPGPASVSPGQAAYLAYIVLFYALGVLGLALLLYHRRKLRFEPAALELPRGERFSAVVLNPGALLFLGSCLALIGLSL